MPSSEAGAVNINIPGRVNELSLYNPHDGKYGIGKEEEDNCGLEGPIKAFVIGIRMGSRRIETLVHIKVTNV